MLLGNSNVSQDVKPLYHGSTRTSGGRLEKWDLSLEKALKAVQNDDRHIFTALRNKVVNSIKKVKAEFFLRVINEAKGNGKVIWENLNKLKSRGAEKSKKKTLNYKLMGF